MDHASYPRNPGVMDHPDLTGIAGTPGNGPFMVLSLRLQDGRIAAAKFQTYGCGPTIASGSMLTEMILILALDGVPPDKLHGPELAIAALRDALARSGQAAVGGRQ
jgi:NifU-like protein involved in Fe-S cluster formation